MGYTNDDFFRIFGEISVYFATLDFWTTLLIFRLVRVDRIEKKNPISDRTTLGQKLGFLGKLQNDQVFDQDVLRDLRKILAHAIEISQERNRYIHDLWEFAGESIAKGEIRRLTFIELDKWLMPSKSKRFTLGELEGFRDQIYDVQNGFGALLDRLDPNNQAKNAAWFLKPPPKEE